MEFSAKEYIELAKALAWPATAVLALVTLHGPISQTLRTIADRATKFSIFKIEIELAKLNAGRQDLATTVDSLRKASVTESGIVPITSSINPSSAVDYLEVNLGGDDSQRWLTSRLFLLAALLERSRVVRCIVFKGGEGAFIGAATPRDLRIEIGARFPEYEKAIARAFGSIGNLAIEEFRAGDLSSLAVTTLATQFLISRRAPEPDMGQIVTFSNPGSKSWTYLDRSDTPGGQSTWELAEWVTAAWLKSMIRDRLSTGAVVAASGIVSEETAKEIVNQSGAFVALLKSTPPYAFEGLCDRANFIDKIARRAA
jgi:hypothetical protein